MTASHTPRTLAALAAVAALGLAPACGDDGAGTTDTAASAGTAGGSDLPGAGGQTAGATSTSSGTAGGDPSVTSGGEGGAGQGGSGGSDGGGSSTGGGAPSLPECGDRAAAPNPWLVAQLGDLPELTGDFTSRQFVELPRRIHDATGTNAKYAFDLRDDEEPRDPRAAFVDVAVTELASPDIYGGAIQTRNAPGATVFLSNVHIEPSWPAWESYATTNYDGMVLDGAEAVYAEDLTIAAWNADSAADIKAQRAEFVCLTTEGDGNRTLRFWQPGPHYIVRSSINNGTGDLLWMQDCSNTTIRVFDSTFNGESEVPAELISCDQGADPTIEYLDVDPRSTGEMHPMFAAVD